MLTFENDLLEDLTAELSETDPNFKQSLIIPKIKNAIREVRKARNYPRYYSENEIREDLENYYSNIKALALYDYNLIGGEGNKSRSENNVSITFVDRSSLFAGIIPLSRVGR